jgi:hypothetical protein
MEEKTMTKAQREGIAKALVAKTQREAAEHQAKKDYDVLYTFQTGTYRALLEHLICNSPEAARLIEIYLDHK